MGDVLAEEGVSSFGRLWCEEEARSSRLCVIVCSRFNFSSSLTFSLRVVVESPDERGGEKLRSVWRRSSALGMLLPLRLYRSSSLTPLELILANSIRVAGSRDS